MHRTVASNGFLVRFAQWWADGHLKRCCMCDLPFDEQKLGVDGAMCDACVEIHAPWVFEEVDPLLLAVITSYPYYFYGDHSDLFF